MSIKYNGNTIADIRLNTIVREGSECIQTKTDFTSNTIALSRDYSIYCRTINTTSTITFSFSTATLELTTDEVYTFELRLDIESYGTINFPSTVKWLNGTDSLIAQTGVHYFVFRTDDQGTSWIGNLQGVWK